MPYDINKLRKNVAKQNGKGNSDPDEFRPPKVQAGKEFKCRFFILPPLEKGDIVKGGASTTSMDGYAFVNGAHFINNTVVPCPRIHNDEECPLCQYGFDLMSETDDKKERSAIARNYLASMRKAVNIYFPNIKANPEELRGKVMYMNASQSIYKAWEEALMRDDDGGDDADPMPYGVFFDEMDAYLYQLTITKQGDYNNYDASKFLVAIKQPIATTKDGKPDEAKIKEILEQRIDLAKKFDEPDQKKLKSIVDNLLNNDDNGYDEDEEENESSAVNKAAESKSSDDDDMTDLGETEETSEETSEEVMNEGEKKTITADDAPSEDSSSDEDEDDYDSILDAIDEELDV